MRYVYLSIAVAVLLAVLFAFHKSAVHESFLRGVAKQESRQKDANKKIVEQAVEQAQKDWVAASKHVARTEKTNAEVKEVVRNVIQRIEVPIDACAYLGDDWLSERNAVINYIREKYP